MNDNKYLGDIKYGNIYMNIIPHLIPLMLWSFFIYKYYYIYYIKITNYSLIFLLLLLMPFILVVIQIILNIDGLHKDTVIMQSNVWQPCITLPKNDKNDNDDNDILGVWSYECGENQNKALEYLQKTLQYKFYYLNFTLFLLILIYYKFSGLIGKNKNLHYYRIVFTCIALFCGTLGVVPGNFGESYMWSLIIIMIFSTILNMNIAAFLIVLYTLYIEIK